MQKALIVIDYTNDFVHEDGALTSGEPAQVLHDYIANQINEFAQADEFIAFMVDLHYKEDTYHPETALFPPHNVAGSSGRAHYGEVESLYNQLKEKSNVIYSDKTRYSSFAGTDLALRLRERGINEVHLVGVVTDICVLHTAIDAYNLGFDIVVHEQGVASFNEAGHQWALEHFKQALGAKVI